MEYSLLVSGLIVGISGIFFYRKRQEREAKTKKTKKIQSRFKSNTFLHPSIYQTLLLSNDNEEFSKMYTILTLKKDFCLSQILFSDQKEFVILKGYLKKRIPNFYINDIKLGNIHFGRKYSQKGPNIKKYSFYGTITKEIEEFCIKYQFAHFYSSYWPVERNLINFSEIQESVVYLECDISLLDNEEFIDDFFSCIKSIQEELPKRFDIEKMKCKEDIDKFNEYEKKDFVEKIVCNINKSSTKGSVIKKNNNKKTK